MKRSGMPPDGSRPLEVGEWRGQLPMQTIWWRYAGRRRQKDTVADGGGTKWAANSVKGAWGRTKRRRDAPDARHDK